MKKAILALLAVGTMALVGGCVVEDDEGQFSLTWSITVDGLAGSCAEVGASKVEVIATHSSGDGFSDTFNCTDMAGRTDPLPTGNYTVVVKLLDAGNHQLNSVDIVLNESVFNNENRNIGNFVFAFQFAKASFRVQMGQGANTANCVENGGAGVVLEEIRLSDAAATMCLPFDITGVTNENDQQVTHQTCTKFLCQFRNTLHTIHGLPNGNYLIQVLGYKGATGATPYVCYTSQSTPFTINGNDVTLGTGGVIVAPFTSTDARCNATKPEDE